jgi:hypothetical protein
MTPRAVDPTKYRLHVVSFTCVREGSEPNAVAQEPISAPEAAAALAR